MNAAITPMMAQFLEIKAEYPDALLFYRMGDFYELFFEDAVAAAEALDIALTKRGKHLGDDIPMCGVPVHAAETYLLTLIRKQFRVAVCEQLESPSEAKKRGSKSVVKRGVVRLVTPGTLTEESLLEARRHNFLASFAEVRDKGAVAWVDISTGALHVIRCPRSKLGFQLARIAPREVLVSETMERDLEEIVLDAGAHLTGVSRTSFDSTAAEARLSKVFGVAGLDGFGQFDRPELAALRALVDYLDLTQKGNIPLLRPPTKEALGGTMQIDPATRRNLELTASLSGGRDGSLIAAIDRTVTAAGGRLLEQRLSAPSCDLQTINDRLDAITFAVENAHFRTAIRDALRKVPDMDRALSRLSLDRGGPRDLAAIRNGLSAANGLDRASALPTTLQKAFDAISGHDEIINLLDEALVAEPPMLARDGGFIAPGYDIDLDEARTLRDEGRGVIAGLQKSYSEAAGVSSLKIKHNNVLGYFIETTATHAQKMLSEPLNETFIHRQTTANQVRFTTVELSELETKILNAGGRALEIEKCLYDSLKRAVLMQAGPIGAASVGLAELDIAAALADLAASENWTRPMLDSTQVFDVQGGRHPVVEQALRKQNGTPFVANDCRLGADDPRIWLLTGPNMAGKSTFLRQNALIALLAQSGSFVPADKAHIGIVSQLFSRVGASDDLARGRSTFMVEMVETAAILNQADSRALVILDEIGRGTATYDGLSIAWATLEHLHDENKCRALFATHYHELTALSTRMDSVDNATVSVKEWDGEVIFLHEVKRGAADRSYGVQVARLAGLPTKVVNRAKTILAELESGEGTGGAKIATLVDDLPLFAATPEIPVAPTASSDVEARLQDILPDELSPKEALNLLYELKALAKKP